MPHDIIKLGYFCVAAGCPRAQASKVHRGKEESNSLEGVIVWPIERHWPEFSEVGIARYLYCIKNQCWAGGDLIKLLILSVLLEDPSDETQELETGHSK